MIRSFRQWWYNNEPGDYDLDGRCIARKEVQIHGGPSPEFANCRTCQRAEWLSRIRQLNLFESHGCPTAAKCKGLCGRQGDDLWTHMHSDHRFALGCDPKLNTPKGLCLFADERRAELWSVFCERRCEPYIARLRRQLARACQYDAVPSMQGVDWSKYDFFYFMNTGKSTPVLQKPPIPTIMYGCDTWGDGFQEVIDRVQPEILHTPYPAEWIRKFRIPQQTHVMLATHAHTSYFTRANVHGPKKLDLVVAGAVSIPKLYAPRIELNKQIKPLVRDYRIEFKHHFGSNTIKYSGPLEYHFDGQDGIVRYLNKWSGYLGTSKYVIFGPCTERANEYMLMKYFECMGSGAVPIMPEVQDLQRLLIEPMIHYIPIAHVWKNNKRLRHYLDNYDRYWHIAENAVRWHARNVYYLTYERFENMIMAITDYKYPRRHVT